MVNLARRPMITICADLIAALQDSPAISKTQLAQICKLDTKTTRYIEFMIENGLIERLTATNLLKVSSRGKEFFNQYEKLAGFLEQD